MTRIIRKAMLEDCAGIAELIRLSARGLSAQDYSVEQIEGALQGAFGVDTQLIADGTYFVAEVGGTLVGCGGWSKRKTLFGGDKHQSRNASELDPGADPAKIRAFFVHPAWARRGIGKEILARCESEAASAGFKSFELLATLPGERLYAACGYSAFAPVDYKLPSGVLIQFIPMKKTADSV